MISVLLKPNILLPVGSIVGTLNCNIKNVVSESTFPPTITCTISTSSPSESLCVLLPGITINVGPTNMLVKQLHYFLLDKLDEDLALKIWEHVNTIEVHGFGHSNWWTECNKWKRLLGNYSNEWDCLCGFPKSTHTDIKAPVVNGNLCLDMDNLVIYNSKKMSPIPCTSKSNITSISTTSGECLHCSLLRTALLVLDMYYIIKDMY